MTDPTFFPDDEIVSAVLDGEATPAEVAQVEADPVLRSRLAEFAIVRELVATPVTPLDDVSQRRLLRAALDHAQPTSPLNSATSTSPGNRPAPLRGPLPWWRRTTTLGIGSAAAVVVLAMLVFPTLLEGGNDQGDTASVATDSADEELETQGFGTLADGADEGSETDQDGASADEPGEAEAAGGGIADAGDQPDTGPPSTAEPRAYPDLASFVEQVQRDGATVARDAPATTGYEAQRSPMVELRDRCGSLMSDHLEHTPIFEAEGWVDGSRLLAVATAESSTSELTVTVFDPVRCAVVVED